jgi:hypothetical protein
MKPLGDLLYATRKNRSLLPQHLRDEKRTQLGKPEDTLSVMMFYLILVRSTSIF